MAVQGLAGFQDQQAAAALLPFWAFQQLLATAMT
jgi:hypothetical protein